MVTLESENAASTWLLNSLESFLILVKRLEVAFLSSSKAVFRRDFNCSVFLSFHNHDIFTIDHVWSKYKLSPLSILFMLLCTIYDSLSSTLLTPNLCTMVIWVVEFSREGWKIRWIFGEKSISPKKSIVFCELTYLDARTTDTQRELLFKNSKLLGLGRQIGLKF